MTGATLLVAVLASTGAPAPPTATAAAPALQFDSSWEELAGGTAFEGLTGPVRVGFGEDGADVRLTLESPAAAWHGLHLGAVSAELVRRASTGLTEGKATVTTPLAEAVELDFELDLELGPFMEGLRWGRKRLEASIEVKQLDLALLSERIPAIAAQGKVDATLTVGGSPAAPFLTLKLAGAGLVWRGERLGGVTARWDYSGDGSEATARWSPDDKDPQGPGVDAEFEVPMRIHLGSGVVQLRPEEAHGLKLTAAGLTEEHLRPFWIAPPSMKLTLSGTAQVQGDLEEHEASLDLHGSLTGAASASGLGGRRLPWKLEGRADPRRQNAQLDLGPGVLVVAVGAGVDTTGVMKGEAWAQDAPAEGRLQLDLPVQTLAPFVPAGIYDPQGRVVGKIKCGGTLGRPSCSGAIRAEDAALTLLGVNQRLRDLQLSARVDGTTLKVERLSAQVGLGSVRGELRSSWTATPKHAKDDAGLWAHAEAMTEGKAELVRFPLVQDGLDIGAADARLVFSSTARPDETRTKVEISNAAVRLTAGRLRDVQAIPTNDHVRMLDWAGDVLAADGRDGADERLLLDVRITDRIEVEGPDARLSIGGRMHLMRGEGEAVVRGGFRLVPGGRITLLDTPFDVRGGVLTLEPGPLPTRPVVDLDARTRVVRTHIALKLRGPTTRPELILAASPGLPEYQIITLLLTGQVDAVDDKNGNVRKKVAQLVSRFHSPGLKQQLFDRLGIDKLGVKFKSLAQPMLTVGKQLDRQWYVESVYRHNSEPDENEKEGRVQYRLDPRWTLDTTYGDAGEGTIGAFWRHRFGGPPPPKPPDDWADAY